MMMPRTLVTDMERLEDHKENIQPSREGLSASALAATLNRLSADLLRYQAERRAAHEAVLAESDNLDDPLVPYLEYLCWTRETYPEGSTTEGGLIPLLERCTSHFRDTPYYKNDPRYLAVWLQYAGYSDSPRDVFLYLAKKSIGLELARFYEEYAEYLEKNERPIEARKVYEAGIKAAARPLKRLQNRFAEFCRRMERTGSLETASMPLVAIGDTAVATLPRPLFPTPELNPKRQKVAVFNDATEIEADPLPTQVDTWQLLASISEQQKENRIKAIPWAGEVLDVAGGVVPSAKITVWRDEPVRSVIRTEGKKHERLDLNLDLLRGADDEELCLEEVLAMNLADNPERDESPRATRDEVGEERLTSPSRVVREQPQPVVLRAPLAEAPGIALSLPLNDTSTYELELPRPPSPTATMTFFSAAARGEVFGMFNQPAQPLVDDSESENQYTDTITAPPRDDEVSSPFLEEPRSFSETEFDEQPPVLDPTLPEHVTDLLQRCQPPLASYAGFTQYSTVCNRAESLKKATRRTNSAGKKSVLMFGENLYCVRSELGEGGFATVYLAETGDGSFCALKVQTPASAWEFYILRQARERLEAASQTLLKPTAYARVTESLVKTPSLHLYPDESYLVLDYVPQGTILDVANRFRQKGTTTVDEVLVMFLAIELLRTVEGLHSVGIIHGDIKADNCMVRFSPAELWASEYDRDGRGGWHLKGITLIDFGRAIDTTLYEPNSRFCCSWKTDQQDCPAMREGSAWAYDADYYGTAGIIHILLFGRPIECVNEGGRYRLVERCKRYWQVSLWESLFEQLINPRGSGRTLGEANIAELQRLREHMEDWLELHSEGDPSLKSLIEDFS